MENNGGSDVSLFVLVEIPVLNANSVDPGQTLASTLFANVPFMGRYT